ncbi:DUF3102 domain-containing protein [Desulfosporosinus fructosivorans]|uniref:DUF3102 domain-containing protein n=1 Tax=Desulfosporosinus fructosivorans TaxID=2018669 RepID=A0A4Z0R6S5_9FIRM|nr:DUF3102 domain-containing protein [Desulfosporosinus fructosivorans]TGE37667.1 DUF3102 domain-containing protein [Desulfosporosinus fructosivorans]
MSDLITERTPLVIAAEINMIKEQTEKVVLNNAVEVGRRLKEAKEMLQHGEWLKWLEESVSYTERTAQRFLLVFDAYGDQQPAALNAGAQTQRLPNMTYSQALILLGVPEEEREQFIAEMDIENMSVRELQKAVKDREQAFQDREQAFQDRDQALQEKADLLKALDGEKGKNTQLTKERDTLKTMAGDLQKSKQALEQDVEKKQLECDKLKEKTSYKSVQRMSDSLTVAYNKVAANKITFLYENMDKAFKELAYEMTKFASIDADVHAAYKKMVNDFLIKAMQERMGG